MLAFQQIDHLSTSPNHGAVTMGSHHMNRTIGIESGIEAHTRAHTNVLHLTFLIHRRLHGMPGQLGHGAVSLRIYPAFVDGMSEAIGIDSRSRSLQIGIITVEQLMPETVVMLQGGQTTHMRTQKFHDLSTLRMVLRQHVKHLAHGQNGPSISPSPMESRMIGHCFHPSVAEQPFLFDKHALRKLKHLAHSLIVIASFAGVFTHIGHRGNSHKHVVEPKRVVLRTDTGKGPVGQPILLVEHIVRIVGYHISEAQALILE